MFDPANPGATGSSLAEVAAAAAAGAAAGTTVVVPTPAPAPPAAGAAAPPVDPAAIRAEATRAERARIAAITGDPEAKGREGLAAHFAHNTEMSAADAVAALKVAPRTAAAGPTHLQRLAAETGAVDLGPAPPPAGQAAGSTAVKAGWDKAVTAANARFGG